MAKTAVHLSKTALQYVTDRTPQGEQKGLSAHINNALEQLAHLAQTEKPKLSKSEWVELYNVYAGSDLTRLVMPFDLADDLRTHYGTLPQDLTALYDKLAGMTQAQQFAVLDAVRVYWASGEDE
ncbi:hypothetical protein [Aggregatibacter kilianii]|uniref:hypothetical protein n=1 Tax=Aggregatibacter kilianii TaxID=2025884 RepID=UPI000D64247F|nr:hypothetical protein [Aggregatibacter kilianii]